MTKCVRGESNLKSSVYNQNGQNYFEQLTAYDSMSSHLRRVLLAKCVVDDRNKSYANKRKQICKQDNFKPRKERITNDMIDRLARDTVRHPVDYSKVDYDLKYFCEPRDDDCFSSCYNSDFTGPQLRMHNQMSYRSYPTFKSDKSFVPNGRQTKESSFVSVNPKKAQKLKFQDTLDRGYEEDSGCETALDFITREMNQVSTADNSPRSYENRESATLKYVKNEEAKYAKFVYEITRDIMDNCLYTDEELQGVFNSYIENNKAFLNMNRMLYEIYRLKNSLNIPNDSDDEELEDIFCNEQLLRACKIRPPTPPKILNDNKVIEKIASYEKANESKRGATSAYKSVTLVDANPELLVTERDILTSLVESNINPERAHQIYKRLSIKSKHTVHVETDRTKIEQPQEDGEISDLDSLDELNNLHDKNDGRSCATSSRTTSSCVIFADKNIQA